MTDTSKWVDNAIKVLLLEDQNSKGIWLRARELSQTIHLKGKMTLALIGIVVINLEKDQEKLKDESVAGLTDIFRWTDKLIVESLP